MIVFDRLLAAIQVHFRQITSPLNETVTNWPTLLLIYNNKNLLQNVKCTNKILITALHERVPCKRNLILFNSANQNLKKFLEKILTCSVRGQSKSWQPFRLHLRVCCTNEAEMKQ